MSLDLKRKNQLLHGACAAGILGTAIWASVDQPEHTRSKVTWTRNGVEIHDYRPILYWALVSWLGSHVFPHVIALMAQDPEDENELTLVRRVKSFTDAIQAPLLGLFLCVLVEIEDIHVLIAVPSLFFVTRTLIGTYIEANSGDGGFRRASSYMTIAVALWLIQWLAISMEFFQGYSEYGYTVRGVFLVAVCLDFAESAAMTALFGATNLAGKLTDVTSRSVVRCAGVIALTILLRPAAFRY